MPEYGNKANNLIILRDVIPDNVPAFFPLSDEGLRSFMHTNGFELECMWEAFVTAQNGQHCLNDDAKTALATIRTQILALFEDECILTDLMTLNFEEKSLSDWHQEVYQDEVARCTVRSSSNEDQNSNASPGGNEPIANVDSAPSLFSQRIGNVLASYFSEASISQRLAVEKEAVFARLPLSSVLLQK